MTLTEIALADCAQVVHDARPTHDAEVAHVVGSGEYLTTGEAATVIGVSKTTVVNLLNSRQLPFTTVPGSAHRRILRTVAEAYRDRMRTEAAGSE